MVGPSAKRRTAKRLVNEKSCAAIIACDIVRLSTSSYYYKPISDEYERRLIAEIYAIKDEHPRYGYRRVTAELKRRDWRVNKKRVQRLMRELGLRVVRKQSRARRLDLYTGERRRAEHRNDVWSWDFMNDRTEDGRRIKFLNIVDEYTRECYVIRPARSITAKDVETVLNRLITKRGIPNHIRSDNGPEFIANIIKDWVKEAEVETIYIEPGSPWENPYIESFNGTFRDECLNRDIFGSILEAKIITEEWRIYYNESRLHSSLGYIPPVEFIANETIEKCLTPSVATLPTSLSIDYVST